MEVFQRGTINRRRAGAGFPSRMTNKEKWLLEMPMMQFLWSNSRWGIGKYHMLQRMRELAVQAASGT
ncbi:MAG: hypothetical protein CM15mP51_05610 [Porticoccaceae bacterium]|nr:MAG: hypothetical protein CM15mP51_05610 [Porticoccaceae bacterium]